MSNSPFIRDVPAAQALDAWRAALRAAGCPERLPAVTVPLTLGGRPRHRGGRLGGQVIAAVRRGGHGRDPGA